MGGTVSVFETVMTLGTGAGAVIFSNAVAMYAMEWNERVFGQMNGAFARFVVRIHTGGRQAAAYWPSRAAIVFVGLIFLAVGIARLMSG